MSVHNAPYAVGTRVIGADVSTTTALIAAVTSRTFSIKSITISNTAAATLTIEDSTGVDMFSFILPARGGVARDFDPGELPVAASGRGINILSSTADVVSAHVTAWYTDA